MSQARIDQLKAEIAQLEAKQLEEKRAALWSRVSDLCREDMQLLRNMLTQKIYDTYDSDDE